VTQSGLDQTTFDRAWAAGRSLPLDEAITEALHIARQVAQPAEVPA
jgi:hypothetical protein